MSPGPSPAAITGPALVGHCNGPCAKFTALLEKCMGGCKSFTHACFRSQQQAYSKGSSAVGPPYQI